ncbi:pilus assembly protein [Pseudoalteromonas denitrificans]|uniref:Type IV pilus assembly protein PilY1 n=1 Tax=Pseudoalteromonas denitrificans DSM 6059 TaxID=1123010 RepID=A0A1I1QRK4_9GAMM|nr:PilC/PilY family type IV pilus protein [Pseudoalteromonas denitrificans]SFD24689.1 type IV pilus assembly protein PilY1 [Pseudoalteromonas denitrificans DSM 6059]
MLKKITIKIPAICLALLFASPQIIKAEDIEIYVNHNVKDLSEKPRALIIFDSSGSMAWSIADGHRCRGECWDSRMKVAKSAIKSLITHEDNQNIDFGLMRFNSTDGGYVIEGLGASQSDLVSAIDNKIWAGGGTPLTETMWEAYRYLSGQGVDFAKNVDDRDTSIEHYWKTYTSPFVPSKDASGKDILRCDNSVHVIMMTDGDPSTSDDSSRNTSISQLAGGGSGDHLDELAKYMHDENTDLWSSTSVKDTATVHTIGFGTGMSSNGKLLLKNTAAAGGGVYTAAETASDLTKSLNQIFRDIKASNTSFTAPSVSSNSSKVKSGDYVYYAMFYPSTDTRWAGNLKKFEVNGDKIIGGDGKLAVDDGKILDSAQSFWLGSNAADGSDVKQGGANLQLTNQSTRTIYTDIADSDGILSYFNKTTALTMDDIDNDSDLANFMGTNAGGLDNLFSWAIGNDVDNENSDGNKRKDIMGDPLHSKPIAIDYGNDDIRIVIGTNAGFVHMFKDSGDTVSESWAFIPKELYPNLIKLRDKQAGKVYGMDAPVSVYFKDDNANGKVDESDKVFAYFGMRRGGSTYYALNITDPNTPKLLWIISPTQSPKNDDFSELGQTWSKPYVTYVDIKGHDSNKPVLIFGAGYDPIKDDSLTTDTTDKKGRGVYIVDAESGELLWSLTPAGTGGKNTHFASIATDSLSGLDSVPSAITTLDSDYDGIVDRLYFGDTGGKVWRVDMPGSNPFDTEKPWKPHAVADLSATKQKFFYAPEVASTYFSKITKTTIDSKTFLSRKQTPFEAILIGSGDRVNPVSDTKTADYLYMIRDENTITQYFASDKVPEPANVSKLLDITSDPFNSKLGSDKDFRELELEISTDFKGWLYKLSAGEKSLSKPVVAGGVAYFSTFSPGSDAENQCSVSGGNGGLYAFHLLYGTIANDIKKLNIGDSIPDSPPIYLSVENKEIVISLLCPGCEKGIIPELHPVLENEVAKDINGDGKIDVMSTKRLKLDTVRSYIYRLE